MRLEDFLTGSERVRLLPAVATDTNEISIGGILQPAIWLQHVQVEAGDYIQVLLVERPDAQAQAIVIGRTGRYLENDREPAEGTVTAAPAGSTTITVRSGGVNYTANFLANYTPAVNDVVRLLWHGNAVTVLGKIGVTAPPAKPKPPPPPPQTAPPPPEKTTGYDSFAAADSATWAFGVWNLYGYGRDVYQGNGSTWGASSYNNGAWFYHGRPGKLKGKKITRVQFWVPPRERAGSYNSAATMNVKLHRSSKRPSGDVTRVASHSISIPAGFRGGWRDLPTSWGDDLVNGGGIGISGGTYMGFTGIGSGGIAKSGQLTLSWEG
mgnify:CR=1 FL=1